jgi:benzoyl-CoA reductase/2-hydroxyglutaryl-CoA dehydratase subunit BcrC/BadD/HgdB
VPVTASNVFKTAAMMKEMMAGYYAAGEEARQKGIPVAWVTAVFPVEIIYAAGLFPYYPENFGAVAAARKVADQLSAVAEARGYAHDLCGYARCGIGDAHAAEHPVGRILKPDLLFCCNTQCGSLPKWFEVAGRFYDAPYFLLDAPQVGHETDQLCISYFVEQLHELIAFIEQFTGSKFDYDRLTEVLALSNEACRLWNEVLDTAALRPAPFGFFDACFHMAPIVTWRGTVQAVNYYRALQEEVAARIEKGIHAIPGERFKIYFDHIPCWPRLRWFSDLFASHGALVAVSQYTHSWAYSFDLNRPLESLAESYTHEFVNRCFDHRVGRKMNFMKKYGIDGFVLFSNRSCKPNALGLYDKRKQISEKTGLPGVVFEADMSDLRFFSEAQVLAKLEPFFEQLSRTKSGEED